MIGVLNLSKKLYDNLHKKCHLFDLGYQVLSDSSIDRSVIDGLVINWIKEPEKNQDNSRYLKQIKTLEKYKKIPLVILDNEFSLTVKETKWLKKKYKTTFFEPALRGRPDFVYLPHTIHIPENGFNFNYKKRNIDLGYIGEYLEGFNRYFARFSRDYNVEKFKISYFPSDNWSYPPTPFFSLNESLKWTDIRFTIAIGSLTSYKIGYLHPFVTDALSNGCNVMFPLENKYFCGISHTQIIKNFDDMYFLLNLIKEDIWSASLTSTYESIKRYYPEFTIEYATNAIVKGLK